MSSNRNTRNSSSDEVTLTEAIAAAANAAVAAYVAAANNAQPNVSSRTVQLKTDTLLKNNIILSTDNFSAWNEYVSDIAYNRNWPDEFTDLTDLPNNANSTWDGVEEQDNQQRGLRREAYYILMCTIPEGSTYRYLSADVSKGDTNHLYRKIVDLELSNDIANRSLHKSKFFAMTMKNTRTNYAVFAAMVYTKATELKTMGEEVTNADKKAVFLQGLSKQFEQIKTILYRSTNAHLNFEAVLKEVKNFAKENGLNDTRDNILSINMFNNDVQQGEGKFKKKSNKWKKHVKNTKEMQQKS